MDSGPLLMVYQAEVVLAGPKGKRKVAIEDWFKGPRQTAIKNDELVTELILNIPKEKNASCYVKLGRYKGEDLAQASVMVMALAKNQYRVSFGSVGPVPIRSYNIEDIFDDKDFDDALISEALEMIPFEITPITDIRATKEYRIHMCQVMFERALRAAVDRLRGIGPKYGAHLI